MFPNQIHYHSVWRDHLRDYGADLSLTTAATVSISGRVATPKGKGLRGAQVTLIDANGEVRSAKIGINGYYRFSGVAAGETYIL